MERWIIIAGGRHKITSPFGYRQSANVRGGARHFHNGVDLSAAMRTPIICPLPGYVRRCYSNILGGLQLAIEHTAHGYTTGYAHLDGYGDGVREGAPVQAGQTVAYSGNSGESGRKHPDGTPRPYDPHLHFTVRKGRDFIDPASVLAPYQPEED